MNMLIADCPECGGKVSGNGWGPHEPEVWDGRWWHRACLTAVLVRAEETS